MHLKVNPLYIEINLEAHSSFDTLKKPSKKNQKTAKKNTNPKYTIVNGFLIKISIKNKK